LTNLSVAALLSGRRSSPAAWRDDGLQIFGLVLFLVAFVAWRWTAPR